MIGAPPSTSQRTSVSTRSRGPSCGCTSVTWSACTGASARSVSSAAVPGPRRRPATRCAGRRRTPGLARSSGGRCRRRRWRRRVPPSCSTTVRVASVEPREQIEPEVVAVGSGERPARRARCTRVVAHADEEPVSAAAPVGVGEHEVGAARRAPPQLRRRQRSQLEHELRCRRGARRRRRRRCRRRRPRARTGCSVGRGVHDRHRVAARRTAPPAAGRRPTPGSPAPSSRSRVRARTARLRVGPCRSRRVVQARRHGIGEQLPERRGSGRVVALVLRGRSAARSSRRRRAARTARATSGSNVPSWSRRSSASSRFTDGGVPVREHLARDVGPVDQARGDRLDGVAPAVRGEVAPGDLEHPRACRPRVAARRRRPPSTRGRPRAGRRRRRGSRAATPG